MPVVNLLTSLQRVPRCRTTLRTATETRDEASIVALSSFGISFAIRSTSAKGMSSVRPTSRITPLAAMVPKVMIWATFSRPYFRPT